MANKNGRILRLVRQLQSEWEELWRNKPVFFEIVVMLFLFALFLKTVGRVIEGGGQ